MTDSRSDAGGAARDAAESLEDIQDRILDRLHAGEPIDREALLAAHPAHADALRRFFGLLAVIETPPDAAPAQPSRLGEFEILRELGRGGMGVVYEARQVSLNRRVALKVLPPAMRRDRRLLARFQREAEAAGRLRHPNIVPVYSVGESAGAPFFAMELVEGRSLAEVIRQRRDGKDAGLPPAGPEYRRWATAVVARVADALDYAHGRGILHRDVKPGNILLETDGTPRLTDFGLALDMQASELTVSGEVFGSPLYMSPEQAIRREQPIDARTDIYSLAVTLYELLSLRLPYQGTTHAELMYALSTGVIVAPRLADPGLPEALERVLVQALRSNPHDRYDTAATFAADLRAAMDHPEDVKAHAGTAAGAARGEAAMSAAAGSATAGTGARAAAVADADDGAESAWSRPRRAFRKGLRSLRQSRIGVGGGLLGCGCLGLLVFFVLGPCVLLMGGPPQPRGATVSESDRALPASVQSLVETHPQTQALAATLARFRSLVLEYDLSSQSVMPSHLLAAPDPARRADYREPTWPPLLGGLGVGMPPAQVFTWVDGASAPETRGRGVCFEGLLRERFVSHDAQLLVCPDGVSESGGVTAQGYATVLVSGAMAGRMLFESYATLVVDGDLSGSVEARSYANLLVTGDLTGSFEGRTYSLLYVEGRVLGQVELLGNSQLWVAGRTDRADLARIRGSARVLLADSELGPGEHVVGQLKVTVLPAPTAPR